MNRNRQPIQLPLFDHETRTVATVAKILNLSDQSVRRLIKKGLLRGYRHDRRGWWEIYVRSLLEYEEKLRKEYPLDAPSASPK